MRKITVRVLIVAAFYLAVSASFSAYAKRPLGILMEVSRSRDEMVEELNEETESYMQLKDSIEKGELDEGTSCSRIARRYGEPVLTSRKNNITKWVYKPGDKTFFDGTKIYLYFDRDKKLVGWESETPSR